jgi:quinohemoprotein amine dehydrogenase
MKMKRPLALAIALTLLAGVSGRAAHAFSKDSLVSKKCGYCHAPTADGKISRVEEVRTTPEEWTVIVDRMRRVHKMDLKVEEMDGLLKELCATQILTPEEQAKVSYLSLDHNSQQMETPAGKDEERLFVTCVRCHTAGKIWSYRMTKENWAKVRDFHLYVDPAVIYQMREMHWRDEADAVLQYLSKAQGYGQAWAAPAARLQGSWAMFGYEPGKGAYRGEAEVKDAGNGEVTLSGTLRYEDGTSEVFGGDGTLYGGYALRTRTRHGGFETKGAYTLVGDRMTGENHFPAPKFRTSSQTWLRKDTGLKVARVTPSFLLAGQKTTLTIDGVGLPDAATSDVSFTGAPVKVLSVEKAADGSLQVTVTATPAKPGHVTVKVKGLDAGSVAVAPKIDYIAVTPGTGRARLAGGAAYAAEGVQFEAIAYAKGPNPKDKSTDVALGPVPATFALAEEKTRPDDDDLQWAGAIAANGSYVPAGDYGPIATRTAHVEAVAWVKVLATYKEGAKTYKGQAQLAVCDPDFIKRIR